MALSLAGLPAELRNLVIGHVAQLPAADLARASRVNRELNEHPLLLKALLKTHATKAKGRPRQLYWTVPSTMMEK